MSGGYLCLIRKFREIFKGECSPCHLAGFREEIRHEDLVWVMLIANGKNVGALQRLGEVCEDIIDVDNAERGIRRASDVLCR